MLAGQSIEKNSDLKELSKIKLRAENTVKITQPLCLSLKNSTFKMELLQLKVVLYLTIDVHGYFHCCTNLVLNFFPCTPYRSVHTKPY